MIFDDRVQRLLAAVLANCILVVFVAVHAQTGSAEPLSRPELRVLVPVTARDLARHPGPLVLDAVVVLPVESAGLLAPHRGWLSLGGLESIDEVRAAELARHSGPLALDGLLVLPPRAAAALARLRHPLSVGLLTLTPETAIALADHRGVLVLSRLDSLSPAAARAIALHRGPVAFPRLTELSYATAVELSRLPHPLSFDILGGPPGDTDPLAPFATPSISATAIVGPR